MTDSVFAVDSVTDQQGMANLIIGFYPNIPSVYEKIGSGFEKRGHFAQAAAVYARLIEQLPRDASGYFLMARLYRKMGKDVEAETFLKKALSLNEVFRKNLKLSAALRA